MDNEFLSIVQKLAILEGRIAPKDSMVAETVTKQKKPALFNNLKKTDAPAGVAEERSDDVLSQVKASLVDYLKSAEDNIKKDRDLVGKKKQDLDLKKRELKDLELQAKKKSDSEEVTEISRDRVEKYYGDVIDQQVKKIGLQPDMYNKLEPKRQKGIDRATTRLMSVDEDHVTLQPGDRVSVIGPNEHQGEFAEVVELSPSGKFVVISLERTGDEVSMHLSDVELTANESQRDDDDDYDDSDDSEFVEEEPNQTPASGEAAAGESDPTYATGGNSTYAESAPVKTVHVELQEMGGGVLVEIHGDERAGFCIRRAGKELPTRFASLAEAEMALEMFNIRRAERQAAEQSADYIEEK